ncbi:MAG TPA: hypothetical protein VKJ07_19765 [Mycobacteriales bacterium]|nr:hypothetical protein [Mycobacteriales bacterium]
MPDMETPEADALEQQQDVEDSAAEGEALPQRPVGEAPLEVDEGDLVESSLEVPLDDDDWR